MKRLLIPATLNALLTVSCLVCLFTNTMRAELIPSKVKGENMERIPDGSYLIPPNEANGRTETSVQIVDGDACFISVIGRNGSRPFQIDVFTRDGIEAITITRGDERRVIVAKDGEAILPKKLTPEQKEELRAIGLTMKLYINILGKNHGDYLKEKIE